MKKYKYLFLGAGRMTRGALYYLARYDRGAPMHLVDIDRVNIRNLLKTLPAGIDRKSVSFTVADIASSRAVPRLMESCVAAISASHYRFNGYLTETAIKTRCHMVDLGGNVQTVRAQFRLHAEARRRGICIIPDCGLAPGMTNILALWGTRGLGNVASIKIRVGGVPLNPDPPLNYMLVFSPEGLINEYIEEAMVIRSGKVTKAPSMADVETLVFPAPFGKMEAFNTSGGSSTLVETLRGKVRELSYKTIRYPGHCAIMRGMKQIGLLSRRRLNVDGKHSVIPRAIAGALLEKNLPRKGTDAVLVRIIIEGRLRQGGRKRTINLIDVMDRRAGLTAMMRCTAFPAACIARMMADGIISEKGVLTQEKAVPPSTFVTAMRKAGLKITSSTRTL